MHEDSFNAIQSLAEVSTNLPKQERLREFLRRLGEHERFATEADAFEGISRLMREIEDQFSGIPANPNAHLAKTTDGRMYPPHESYRKATACSEVSRYRQKAHSTSIGSNGAVLIESVAGTRLLDKPGSDGRTIDEIFGEAR